MNLTDELRIPCDIDGERNVLGAILLESSLIDQAVEILRPDDYYLSSHRVVFAQMLDMQRRRVAIDFASLTSELGDAGQLEAVGGRTYIASLIDGVPRTDDLSYYAKRVRAKAARRALMIGCNSVIDKAGDPSIDDGEVIETAERIVYEASADRQAKQFEQIGHIVFESLEYAERISRGEVSPGIETRLTDLDYMLCGLQPGNQYIIAGRPSMGKTGIGLCIARNTAKSSEPTGIFELEMSKRQLGNRLLAMEARVDLRNIQLGSMTREEWARCGDASNRIADYPLHIDDTGGMTLSVLCSKARRLVASKGVKLIVVDYLQLIIGEKTSDNRNNEIGLISRRLKDLAKELDIPIVLLSQLSRANEHRADKEPQLSDLRDSGEIEQNADAVIFIHRDEYYEAGKNAGIARLLVRKQRNGPTGEVEVAFDGRYTAFENLAR